MRFSASNDRRWNAARTGSEIRIMSRRTGGQRASIGGASEKPVCPVGVGRGKNLVNRIANRGFPEKLRQPSCRNFVLALPHAFG
jgi:hypothetical protein